MATTGRKLLKTKSGKEKIPLKNLTKNLSLKKLQERQIVKKRPIIQVKNLVKTFNGTKAVNKITFEVQKGEIFGILGPNGAGKTTTLEIIETIIKKTSGQVLVDGLDIDIYPKQVKSIIGIQLQSSGFYPKLTLIECLHLFSDVYNVEIDAYKLLETVNLKDKAKTSVESLSGGQKQRFAIAATLVSNPEIIFLDEPTTGLDPQARRNLWDMIKKMKSEGKTVVMTTHYMDEAEYLCDRLAIMDMGKIIEVNTPKKFIEELLNRGFTKEQKSLRASLEDVFLDLTGRAWRD